MERSFDHGRTLRQIEGVRSILCIGRSSYFDKWEDEINADEYEMNCLCCAELGFGFQDSAASKAPRDRRQIATMLR